MYACEHLVSMSPVEPITPEGCGECLATGDRWVHLRLCMTCGRVGCCDSSPNRHATAHALASGHRVIQSFEVDEDWAYCYTHDQGIEHVPEALRRPRVAATGTERTR
jgi:uncharacterized UBP type Zn finger protein